MQNPAVMLQDPMLTYLPEDPLPGQIVNVPDGINAGSSVTIYIHHNTEDDDIIGMTDVLSKIENVSRRWKFGRTITRLPLEDDMIVHILGVERPFASVIFNDMYGWAAHTYKEDIVVTQRTFRVKHTVTNLEREGYYIYDEVCVALLPKEPT